MKREDSVTMLIMLWNMFINDFKQIMKKSKEKFFNFLKELSKKIKDILERNSNDKDTKNLQSFFQYTKK